MYKIVCETLIRQRETGEDERVQISLPLCKIKSDQTLTL
nr:MAG TPA: structural protein [Caudoviricetes sp.]